MRKIWIALTLMITFSALADSNRPTPSLIKDCHEPQTQAVNRQECSANNQRGTEIYPLFVKVDASSVSKEATPQKREDEKASNDRLLAYATVALAIVTAVLAVFTWMLWKANRILINDARDTARRQLRAYVFPEKVGMKKNTAGIDIFTIEISNSGQTPAYDVQSWVQVIIREFPLQGELKVGVAESKIFIASKGGLQIISPGPRPYTTTEVESIRKRTQAIYVYGEICYFDIFKKERRITKYCFMSVGDSFRDNKLVACEIGNEAN